MINKFRWRILIVLILTLMPLVYAPLGFSNSELPKIDNVKKPSTIIVTGGGASGNPFDQSLNTTDFPSFANNEIEYKNFTPILSTSDSGINFKRNATINSSIFTEVNGQVLSFGINAMQSGRNTTHPAIIYRLDSRGAGSFDVVMYPAGGTAFYTTQKSVVGGSTIFYHPNTVASRTAAQFGLSGWGGIFYSGTATNEVDLSGSSVAIQSKGNAHFYNDNEGIYVGRGKDSFWTFNATDTKMIKSVGTPHNYYFEGFTSVNLGQLVRINFNTTSMSCNATTEGMIYYDGSLNKHRGCDGTIWNNLY